MKNISKFNENIKRGMSFFSVLILLYGLGGCITVLGAGIPNPGQITPVKKETVKPVPGSWNLKIMDDLSLGIMSSDLGGSKKAVAEILSKSGHFSTVIYGVPGKGTHVRIEIQREREQYKGLNCISGLTYTIIPLFQSVSHDFKFEIWKDQKIVKRYTYRRLVIHRSASVLFIPVAIFGLTMRTYTEGLEKLIGITTSQFVLDARRDNVL